MYVALKNLTTQIFESKILFYTLWMGIVFIASSGNFRFISKINGFQVLIMFVCFGLVFFKLCFHANLDINYIKFFKLNKIENFAPIRWFLLPFMFTIVGQDMFMNVINTKDKKNVLIGSIFAAFFYTVFCLGIIFIGFIGNELGFKKTSVVGNVVLHLTGTLTAGVFFVVIFLAIVTTINAVLNVCSYMTKNDLKLTFKNRDLTVFIGICIIFIGDKFSEVIFVIHTAYGITSMAIFIPFSMIMLLKNPNTTAAIFSSMSGVLGFLYFDIISKDLFLGDLKALLVSILTFAFFQLFLKKS
jgi:Na+/proline symporter